MRRPLFSRTAQTVHAIASRCAMRIKRAGRDKSFGAARGTLWRSTQSWRDKTTYRGKQAMRDALPEQRPQLMDACVLLALCAVVSCGEPVEIPLGPGATPMHMWQVAESTDEAQHAHPGQMPPSRWAVVQMPFVLSHEHAAHAFAHAIQAEACTQTQGQWHAGLWACRCPLQMAFVPRRGCMPLPDVVAAQSFCTQPWATSKTACLRDIQLGRSAWHLHFSGRAGRTQAVRQALVAADAAALVGHTLSLPPAAALWSMHLTDRLGPQTNPYLGFDDTHATLMPDQYTQAWVRVTSVEMAQNDSVRLAETCRKALAQQALLPVQTAAALCRGAADGLAHVRQANKDAWPQARSAVWRTEPVAHISSAAYLGALAWQIEMPDATDATKLSWRVVLRDEVVLARQLQVRHNAPGGDYSTTAHLGGADAKTQPPQPFCSWRLTLVCDGSGAVQAWHIVSPEAPEQTGMLLPCYRALQPRRARAKRAQLVLGGGAL